MTPETRYARRGDLYLAYQILGDGPTDLLLVDQWFSHMEDRDTHILKGVPGEWRVFAAIA